MNTNIIKDYEKKKILLISIIILIAVIIVGILGYFYLASRQEHTSMSSRCINYNPANKAVDCYGLISIFANEGTGYTLNENNPSIDLIASINNLKEFKVDGDYLYVINKEPNTCYDKQTSKYCADFMVNGKLTEYEYNSPSEIPTYIMVNTMTGNESVFNSINDASSSSQSIFTELQSK